jgi:hypothetical protein
LSQSKVDKYTVIELRLTDAELAALEKRAKDAGYQDVRSYLEAIVKGGGPSPPAQAESVEGLAKRLERLIQDMLNPFTQKVDDLAKRLAQIEEDIESLKQERQAQQPQAERREAEAGGRQSGGTAVERLRRQGVVFQEELPWLKAPDKFFAKLGREGAVVLTLSDGRAAVDPEFWKKFVAEVESTSLKDPRQVSDKVQVDLGERAAALFNKMVRSGLIIYDEDTKKWRVAKTAGKGGGGPPEYEAEEAEEDEEGYL